MSDRLTKIVLLCEDRPQASLVRGYLKKCGINTNHPYLVSNVASEKVCGGNVGWVIGEFPKQLHACRQYAKRMTVLLIVVVDADNLSSDERRKMLFRNSPPSDDDPVAVLIPRRHIETWIRSALGDLVDEVTDYKKPSPDKIEIRGAAAVIHGWARENPSPGETCVPSLREALWEWRKIC